MGFQYQRGLNSFGKNWTFRPLDAMTVRSSKIHRGGNMKAVPKPKAVAFGDRIQFKEASKLPIPKKPNIHITTITTELIIEIFSYLRPVSATIFGLTCTRLFRIKTDLDSRPVRITQSENGQLLYVLLRNWMAPDFVYAPKLKKFVTIRRWLQMREERRIALKHMSERRFKRKSLIERKRARDEAKKAEILRCELERLEFDSRMRDIRARRRMRHSKTLPVVDLRRKVSEDLDDVWEL